MPRSADKLAFALSSAPTLTLEKYNHLFDHLYATDATAAGYDIDEIADWRRETRRRIADLGMCDFFYGEHRLAACRPALTLLPLAGLPSALLTGARTRAIIQRLRSAVKDAGHPVDISVAPQHAFVLLPNRIVVQAENLETLRTCAAAAGLPVQGSVGRGLLIQAYDLETYLAKQRRAPAMELAGWARTTFDPDAVSWRGSSTASFQLSMYTHPQNRGREFFLYDGAEMQQMDPAWGRYAVLARTQRSVLGYDDEDGVLLVPAGARLPPIFERGLTLLSGFAAQRTWHEGTRALAFVRIDPADATIVARKLAQQIVPTRRPASIRGAHD